jgi:glycosyltransferase involved in cell wall biosynthesis
MMLPKTNPRGLRLAMLCGSIKPLFSGTEDYQDRLAKALRQVGADVVDIDIGNWRLQRAKTLLRAVSAARPDAILLQYPTDAFGRSLLPQAFATVQRIAPLVVTVHEFTAGHPLRRLALAPLLLRASAVVTTAQREMDGVLSWYPWLRRRMHVIPIGSNMPPRDWQPAEPASVVYFGQIRPSKGLEHVLDCRDQLAGRFPDARFSIIGSRVPQFAAYCDEIAAACAARGVTLLMGLPEAGVSAALAAAQCALLPFPDGASFRRTSLLAAAGCGTPIVTLAGPDTPAELTALLRPATEPGQLTDHVAALLSDEAGRQDAHARSLQVAARVSWNSIAAQHMAMLGAICAGTSARAVAAVP